MLYVKDIHTHNMFLMHNFNHIQEKVISGMIMYVNIDFVVVNNVNTICHNVNGSETIVCVRISNSSVQLVNCSPSRHLSAVVSFVQNQFGHFLRRRQNELNCLIQVSKFQARLLFNRVNVRINYRYQSNCWMLQTKHEIYGQQPHLSSGWLYDVV